LKFEGIAFLASNGLRPIADPDDAIAACDHPDIFGRDIA
jgi:hypothetical protein